MVHNGSCYSKQRLCLNSISLMDIRYYIEVILSVLDATVLLQRSFCLLKQLKDIFKISISLPLCHGRATGFNFCVKC